MSQINRFPAAFFISGTDTDVGKTVVSAVLLAGLDAAYWKPVQSGLDAETDTDFVRRVTGAGPGRFLPERWRLSLPLSPHASAAIDGVSIALSDFNLPETGFPHLIVEGAGGLMVPLNDNDFMIDLIRHLGLPVLLVARSGLGTINHTLLSLEQIRFQGLDVLGVVMNGPENMRNREAIERYGNVEVWAEIGHIPQMTPDVMQRIYQRHFLWLSK